MVVFLVLFSFYINYFYATKGYKPAAVGTSVTTATTTNTTTTTTTNAAPKSILKKNPITSTTTSHQVCPSSSCTQRLASTVHSPSAGTVDGTVVRSGSVSSVSLRDSLEITKTHLHPSGRPSESETSAKVSRCFGFINWCIDRLKGRDVNWLHLVILV